MKKLILSILFLTQLLSPNAYSFWAGFNQGWIQNYYGGQWVSKFDAAEFERVIRLAHEANATRLRFWLFEGFNSEAIQMKNGRIQGLHPDFLPHLQKVLELAKQKNIKLHLTLFDGNLARWKAPDQALKNHWWDLLNNKNGVRMDFVERVYLPLLSALHQSRYAATVEQIDLVNEINVFTFRDSDIRFENRWTGANQFICELKKIKTDTGLLPKTRITASLGWSKAIDYVLDGALRPECIDSFVIHLYNFGGDISRCKELASYAKKHGKQMILGEFGQGQLSFSSDWLQKESTSNFLENAKLCGFDGAMAWRLSGEEGGEKFLFIRGTTVRPAYDVFRRTSRRLSRAL
ncbi:MAG: hypothetical protein AB7O96_10355 [Pseudobdellovibrionaceae bacterium]